MFPYPSGSLHMGHVRVYTISDVLARFRRMQGFAVIHPMGWDAFGLPAENAAIERGIAPAAWTRTNIEKMRMQLRSMNTDFDWDREICTSDPSYYRWTQYLFLQMHRHGLVYRKEALVNWDPVERTVLANEQVDSDGRAWRSRALVEKVSLEQWFMAITKYREPLLRDLDSLTMWPENVKQQQRNWIGKSSGVEFRFKLISQDRENLPDITAFTTRPDTLYGAEFIALSKTHPLVVRLSQTDPQLCDFCKPIMRDEQDMGTFEITYLKAQPPHDEKLSLPVYVADYVLDYGNGAIIGVPGHDTRDFSLWRRFHDESVQPKVVIDPLNEAERSVPFVHLGVLNDHCGEFSGLSSTEGGRRITETLQSRGFAEQSTQWRLKDWLISRQRYWGCPIPMIMCPTCGDVPVREEDLPIVLPPVSDLKPSSGSSLDSLDEWAAVSCPECGGRARRETDTMDTFVDSSWYYLRYTDPHNVREPFSNESASSYMPVDVYLGGVEHAILHLLYSRYFAKFSASIGMWKDRDGTAEPFKRLVTQGMVHGKTYKDPQSGKYLKPDELMHRGTKVLIKENGQEPLVSFEKMSKSKHNGVDPQTVIDRWGADCTRAYILFSGPVQSVLEWQEDKIVGVSRWLQRLYRVVQCVCEREETQSERGLSDREVERNVQHWIRSVTVAFSETIALNTAVSDLIKATNYLYSLDPIEQVSQTAHMRAVKTLVKLVAPIAPAVAEELWTILHGSAVSSVFEHSWPKYDQRVDLVENARVYAVVQIDGKVRFKLELDSVVAEDQNQLLDVLRHSDPGRKWIAAKYGTREPDRMVVAKTKTGMIVSLAFI